MVQVFSVFYYMAAAGPRLSSLDSQHARRPHSHARCPAFDLAWSVETATCQYLSMEALENGWW